MGFGTDNPQKSFLSNVVDAARSNVAKPTASSIPESSIISPRWAQDQIDYFRWNQLYPYKLMVVKAVQENKNAEVTYTEDLRWQFTLPIPPESLSIGTDFAIQVEATQGGIHEEHNGIVFKDIDISGTTGILPLKGTAPSKENNTLNSIFGGTINQINRTSESALKTAQNFGFAPKPYLVAEDNFQSENDISKTTGYAQFHLLSFFLENYAHFKTTAEGRDYRLALAIYKDNAVYLVTPRSFTLSRTANSAYEYPYSLKLRAWKRIKLTSSLPSEEFHPTVLSPNLMGQVLNSIQNARETIYNAKGIVDAFAFDLDRLVMEPMRKMALFIKEAIGSPLTLMDLPQILIEGSKDALIAYVGLAQYGQGLINLAKKNEAFNKALEDLNNVAKETGLGDDKSGKRPYFKDKGAFNKGAMSKSIDKINSLFKNPAENHQLFNTIQPADLSLSPGLIKAINNERENVRRLTRPDFEDIRNGFEKFLTTFEFSIGGGNETLAKIYDLKLTNNTANTPNDEQFEVIYALNRLIEAASKMAATRQVNRINISGVEYAAGLANRSGIAFKVPVSKFSVPFPYGYSLEDLARQYLGDPDRYMEIAQLNGLRSPYIDEEGFTYNFMNDGIGNQITVSSSSNLYLGQTVWIQSNTKTRTKRQIVGIENLIGSSIITLNGDADMSGFHYLDGAHLHAFLPGTVNSQMTIYIPSQTQTDDEVYQTKDIPGLETFDPIIAAGGVDVLLDNNNDLVITPDGDNRFAIGLTNIIQRVRTMLSVTQGTLNQHAGYGLPIEPGVSVADINPSTLAQSIKNMFSKEPGFLVSNIRVNINPPYAEISFNLAVPGVSQNIPVFYNLNLSGS